MPKFMANKRKRQLLRSLSSDPLPEGHLVNRDSFALSFGFGKRGLLEKGSFQKSPFSRDSREFRDSRDFREPTYSGK